jgi:ATP-binding cassette subfamily C protein
MKTKKEYRIHNNIAYILKYIAQWQKSLIPISALHIITSASTIFVMPFLVKIVIEQIETQKNMEAFMKTVIIYTICMLAIYLSNGFCGTQKGWRLSIVRNKFVKLLMSKVLGMEYQKLETPKVLIFHT